MKRIVMTKAQFLEHRNEWRKIVKDYAPNYIAADVEDHIICDKCSGNIITETNHDTVTVINDYAYCLDCLRSSELGISFPLTLQKEMGEISLHKMSFAGYDFTLAAHKHKPVSIVAFQRLKGEDCTLAGLVKYIECLQELKKKMEEVADA